MKNYPIWKTFLVLLLVSLGIIFTIPSLIYEEDTKNKSDNNKWIRLSDMYPDFKAWWNESISNKRVPNKNELKDYLNNIKVWGKYILPASKWYGFRFKTIEDELHEYSD